MRAENGGILRRALKHGKLGRAMQAVRDNELAAGVVGVDTYRTKVIAFTLCALFGGLGGGLFAGGFTYISPDQFGFAGSVVFLTMALLEGAFTFRRSACTALLILLPESLRFLKVTYLAVYGGAVILLMVFMPEGIWGFLETLRGFPMRVSDSSVGVTRANFTLRAGRWCSTRFPHPKQGGLTPPGRHSIAHESVFRLDTVVVGARSFITKKGRRSMRNYRNLWRIISKLPMPTRRRRGCCLRGGRTRH